MLHAALRASARATAQSARIASRTTANALPASLAAVASAASATSLSAAAPSARSPLFAAAASASAVRSFSSPASFDVTESNRRARLEALRRAADASPDDQFEQYRLLKEMDPAAAIRRIESGKYAKGPSVQMVYNAAIRKVKEQQWQQQQQQQQQQHDPYASYQQPSQQQQQQYANPSSPYVSSSSSSVYPPIGTAANPLVMIDTPQQDIPWLESLMHALARFVLTVGVGSVLFFALQNLTTKTAGEKKDFLSRTLVTTKFSDVKGCDEAKAELQEVVEYLKNPEKFERLGGKMTKGILLTGPPGTGKTLLAKAVAGEANVPFFALSGSELDEIFVGVGAARVRELFAQARKQKKSIIFIDEIDAVGGSRDRIGGSMSRATINALLTEMDGFAENSGLVVIGATNHAHVLDAALVRPGRFDRTVPVSLPDTKGRLDILELYGKKIKLSPEVDLKLLSQTTSGMTGADLSNLLNSAALRASVQGKTEVDHDEIEYAYDKVLMGAERQFTQSPAVKANTAYHEAGHTIMLLHTPGANELHKVTILPRGRALGVMFSLPYNEKNIMTRRQYLARIDIAMGGRVAEELLNGKDQISSGASSDLEAASSMARSMVMECGMGAKTGVFTVPKRAEQGTHPAQVLAPETLQGIDDEVADILKQSYQRALDVITKHRTEWERLAQALIEHELLDAKQVRQAIAGEPVTRKKVNKFRASDLYTPPPTPPAPAPTVPNAGASGGIPMPAAQKFVGNNK